MTRIVRLYWSPTEEFAELSKDPCWPFYYLVLCVGSFLLGLLLHPFIQQVTQIEISRVLSFEEVREAQAYSTSWRIVGIALIPALILAKSLFYGAVAWACAGVLGVILEFKKAMAVIMASMTALLGKGFVAWLILSLRGRDQLLSGADLQPALGLDLVISVSDPLWNTVLRSATIFELGYVALLVIGLSVVSSLSRLASLVTALLILSIGIITQAKLEGLVSDLNRLLS